jgi:hypothetical protein
MNTNAIWSAPLVFSEQGQELPKRRPCDGKTRKAIAVLTGKQLETEHLGK